MTKLRAFVVKNSGIDPYMVIIEQKFRVQTSNIKFKHDNQN